MDQHGAPLVLQVQPPAKGLCTLEVMRMEKLLEQKLLLGCLKFYHLQIADMVYQVYGNMQTKLYVGYSEAGDCCV